ncbi:hypothetical protein ACQUW0_27435, partial [Ralstonia pseudosolanacearum]|uniref:hypothetical protein n=1 Tax=Ralstonia pseudosolanacearum TaxID=1310165 RepID=UPI003D167308
KMVLLPIANTLFWLICNSLLIIHLANSSATTLLPIRLVMLFIHPSNVSAFCLMRSNSFLLRNS